MESAAPDHSSHTATAAPGASDESVASQNGRLVRTIWCGTDHPCANGCFSGCAPDPHCGRVGAALIIPPRRGVFRGATPIHTAAGCFSGCDPNPPSQSTFGHLLAAEGDDGFDARGASGGDEMAGEGGC